MLLSCFLLLFLLLVCVFEVVYMSSKDAGSDPEAFWLRLVMPITASVQPESDRIVYAGSDFLHPVRFHSCKASPDHIAQNRSGSDPDGLVRFWPNGSGPEASRCARIIGPGSAAARYQFPTFRLGCILLQTARIVILYKTSLGNSLVECIRTKRTRSGNKPVCKNHWARFWPILLSRSGSDANRIRMFY